MDVKSAGHHWTNDIGQLCGLPKTEPAAGQSADRLIWASNTIVGRGVVQYELVEVAANHEVLSVMITYHHLNYLFTSVNE